MIADHDFRIETATLFNALRDIRSAVTRTSEAYETLLRLASHPVHSAIRARARAALNTYCDGIGLSFCGADEPSEIRFRSLSGAGALVS